MLETIKQILPSLIMGVAFGWIFHLHGEIADLKDVNASLQDSVRAYNGLVMEWYNENQRFFERRTAIHEALAENGDPVWDAVDLPSGYLRVLEEAGIYDATGSPDAGSSGPATDGDD